MPKFSRQSRITTAGEFDEIFSRGQWNRNDPYVHLLSALRSIDGARLGIKVSKKNVRSAPDRNRLKRIVRESFRHQMDTLRACDCVVLIRQGASTLTNHEFRQHVDRLWIRLKNF